MFATKREEYAFISKRNSQKPSTIWNKLHFMTSTSPQQSIFTKEWFAISSVILLTHYFALKSHSSVITTKNWSLLQSRWCWKSKFRTKTFIKLIIWWIEPIMLMFKRMLYWNGNFSSKRLSSWWRKSTRMLLLLMKACKKESFIKRIIPQSKVSHKSKGSNLSNLSFIYTKLLDTFHKIHHKKPYSNMSITQRFANPWALILITSRNDIIHS